MTVYIEPPFNKKNESRNIYYFHEHAHQYVKRPPYQRKTVWEDKKKSKLIESFLRQLYVPPVVIRQVVLDTEEEGRQLRFEVVDGQQRINAIQEFFEDEIALPETDELRNWHESHDIAGKYWSELDQEVKDYIQSNCSMTETVIENIDEPDNREHKRLATEVFWRLQQGESLNNMEKNHSKIHSPVRNFIVKTADNISFDDQNYESRPENPNRHDFFGLLASSNERLKHLSLLARFLLIEIDEGPTKITGKEVTKLFDGKKEGHNAEESLNHFEQRSEVKRVKKMLDVMYEIYKDSELKNENGEVIFLNKEYFMVSLYTLLRQLIFGDYNFSSSNYGEFREFTKDWYQRWEADNPDDNIMFQFKDARQQNRGAVNKRHYLIEHAFWNSDPDVVETDSQRTFSRAQRIEIFLNDRRCAYCLKEGKSDEEARVKWSNWDADHITMYSEGGETKVENGRVLCPSHNRGRQDSLEEIGEVESE